MIKINVPLYFLGDRTYVNGLTLFEEMLKTGIRGFLKEKGHIVRIRAFRVNRFVHSNGIIEIAETKSMPSGRSPSAALMEIETGGGEIWQMAFQEEKGGNPPERREDYDRGLYIRRETVEEEGYQTTFLHNVTDPFDLMRGIVESNYRYCTLQAEKMNVRHGVSWAYLRDFVWPDQGDLQGMGEVTFQKKSFIRAYGNYYIMRKVSVRNLMDQFSAEICFFYKEKTSG